MMLVSVFPDKAGFLCLSCHQTPKSTKLEKVIAPTLTLILQSIGLVFFPVPETMADSPQKRYSRSPSSRKGRRSPSPRKGRRSPSPRKGRRSPSPRKGRSRSLSKPRSVSRSRSPERRRSRSHSKSRSYGRDESRNPGNTLFVTGLSSRVTERDLKDHFGKEGKVSSVFLVVEPRTQISRGFAFVTMSSLEDADRCIKYLNQSVLEGRYIAVEKSRRKRPRTPTPGNYLGVNKREVAYHGQNRGSYGRDGYDYRRSPRRSSPYRGSRGYSPRRSP